MRAVALTLLVALLVMSGCGEEQAPAGAARHGRPGAGRSPHGSGAAPKVAVPVEVIAASRQRIASFIETNGTLEAETEVDLVARVSAPVVELLVEEGDSVRTGQLLARLDDVELRVQSEIARVAVAETRQAYERAEQLRAEDLISPEEHERAVSAHDSARAQLKAAEIQLEFTQLRAPFSGRIVRRYVDRAEQLSVNAAVYRLSDFDPLLCPVQLPEQDLARIRTGQPAWLAVEAWGVERFAAHVLRISPVVDAETGTIKVTLEIDQGGRLRPGMFARVYIETETRDNAIVVPRAALSLESIGDTIYVASDGAASRRDVTLGFRQGDLVEILEGIAAGEQVVVIGQDGLSEGTPLQILEQIVDADAHAPAAAGASDAPAQHAEGLARKGKRAGFDPASMSAEQLEQIKQRMRSKGMSEEQIERRLERNRRPAVSEE